MRLSKFLAIFGWINTFALVWVLMYGPVPEHRGIVVAGQLFFALVAVVASMHQTTEDRHR